MVPLWFAFPLFNKQQSFFFLSLIQFNSNYSCFLFSNYNLHKSIIICLTFSFFFSYLFIYLSILLLLWYLDIVWKLTTILKSDWRITYICCHFYFSWTIILCHQHTIFNLLPKYTLVKSFYCFLSLVYCIYTPYTTSSKSELIFKTNVHFFYYICLLHSQSFSSSPPHYITFWVCSIIIEKCPKWWKDSKTDWPETRVNQLAKKQKRKKRKEKRNGKKLRKGLLHQAV